MHGDHGHDRKNVGVLVQEFFNTFKNKKQKPALILKASAGTSSYVSREEILDKIRNIKKTINSNDLPNVYLINGEFSDYEMNELYNNPKVKAMVTTTKGEGFGRPLLEFSAVGKPIIASGWSGHLDFLNPSFTYLLPGNLENVHPSAANNWLIRESKWFQVSSNHLSKSLKEVYSKYKQFSVKGKQQKQFAKTNFSWKKMQELVESSLDRLIPEFPKQVELSLPKLNLPKLKKLD
jgi:glycosyltransferase involved in cell wall biosynthesis